MRWIFMILSLALFPAVFLVILMNQILEEMSAENWLPISSTLCLVKAQCPYYRLQKRDGLLRPPHCSRDDTLLFLESNGDIYSKQLGDGERFYLRGECILCFESSLKAKLTNYGQVTAEATMFEAFKIFKIFTFWNRVC